MSENTNEISGDDQVAAEAASWIADGLGQACYDQNEDELPAATDWTSDGPVATITLEDGSRLVVTVRVEH